MQGPKDALLAATWALSNGAGSTNSGGLRLDNSSRGDFTADHEIELTAPALTTAQLPDGETMRYQVETDDDAAFGSVTVVYEGVLIQAGAGGAGAAAVTRKFRLPSNVQANVRLKAVKTGTGNASTVSAVVKLLSTGGR